MTVKEAVAEQVKKLGGNVLDIVAEKLAQIEIDRRVAAVVSAVNLQEQMEKSLQKLDKPDTVTYVAEVKHEAYSSNRFEEVKKLREKLDKLKQLIETALQTYEADSYTKLAEFVAKESGGNSKSQAE